MGETIKSFIVVIVSSLEENIMDDLIEYYQLHSSTKTDLRSARFIKSKSDRITLCFNFQKWLNEPATNLWYIYMNIFITFQNLVGF